MGTKPGTCEGWAGRHSIRVIGWGLQEEGRVTLVRPLGPDKMDSAVSSAPGSSVLHSVQGLRLHKLTIQITPSTHLVIDIRYPACSKAEHRMSKESVTGRTGVTMRKAGHKARSWRPGPHSRDGPSALGNWVQGRLAEQNSRSGTKSASNQHTASKGNLSQSDLMLGSKKSGLTASPGLVLRAGDGLLWAGHRMVPSAIGRKLAKASVLDEFFSSPSE